MKAIIVAALAFALAACSPRGAVRQVAPQIQSQVSHLLDGGPAVLHADNAAAAIQDVIQRGNAEQVQAVASGDSSVMRDTSTGSYYQEVAQSNQNLRDAGVTGIQLIKLEWGPVSVDGATATATTFETWSTSFADGTTEQSRDRNVYTLVQQNGVWLVQADDHPDDGLVTSPAPASPGQASAPGNPRQQPQPQVPAGAGQSHNWSGYAATGGKFTGVSGTWTVPRPSAGTGGTDAAWVGIGGVGSRDLIQAGTEETVSASGRTQYQAWIEMLPQVSHPIALAVHPGDSVTVSINQQPSGEWQIAFKDNTTGGGYATSVQYDSSLSSADWVEEAPSAGRGVLPLDNFGSVAFSQATAVENGKTVNLQQAGARAISMVNGAGRALAVPSAISVDGTGFTVSRTDAPSIEAASGNGFGGNGFGGRGFGRFPRVPRGAF